MKIHFDRTHDAPTLESPCKLTYDHSSKTYVHPLGVYKLGGVVAQVVVGWRHSVQHGLWRQAVHGHGGRHYRRHPARSDAR